MRLRVILEPSDEGGYTVFVPSLPGCISEGQTKDEALDNIRDAIRGCLQVRAENGMPLTIETCQVEVQV